VKRNNPATLRLRRLWFVAALAGSALLPAAELHVTGLNWFGNRKAEQQLKLLLG